MLTDVTIVHPLSSSYLSHAANETLIWGTRGKLLNMEAQRMGMNFLPFSIETLGGWRNGARAVAQKIADHAERFTRMSSSEALSLIQPGVLTMLLDCFSALCCRLCCWAAPLRRRNMTLSTDLCVLSQRWCGVLPPMTHCAGLVVTVTGPR